MTTVTAVPLLPIKKGSMLRLWLGIAALGAAGVGLAYAGTNEIRGAFASNEQFLVVNGQKSGVVTTASGLQYEVLQQGSGAYPVDGDFVLVNYKGALRDGTVFDEGQLPVQIGQPLVPGFTEGLKLMKKGGKYRLWMKPELGYGPEAQVNPKTGETAIPADSILVFDVEMAEHATPAQMQAMQDEMQRRQGAVPGGAPGGAAPGGAPMPEGPPTGM